MKAFNVIVSGLVGISLTVFLPGCTTVKFDVSIPEVRSNVVVGNVSNEIISLDLEEFVLILQMQNFRAKGGTAPRPLGVWLGIQEKVELLSIDPNAIILTTAHEDSVKPISYMGPTPPWQSPRAAGLGCGPRIYEWGWSISKIDISTADISGGNPDKGLFVLPGELVSFEGNVCFVFFFDVDPSPDNDFTLLVRGIKHKGRVIKIPEIRFTKGSVRKFFPVP